MIHVLFTFGLLRFKLDLESQLAMKQNELSTWEARLQSDQGKAESAQASLIKLTSQLQAEREKSDKLQTLYHESMSRQITLQGQKDSLQSRVEQVVLFIYISCMYVPIHVY